MDVIGDEGSGLERRGGHFTVESLAKELRQEWVEDALSQAERESVRERLLPATLTVWLVILMGLFRRMSYVNLLEPNGLQRPRASSCAAFECRPSTGPR